MHTATAPTDHLLTFAHICTLGLFPQPRGPRRSPKASLSRIIKRALATAATLFKHQGDASRATLVMPPLPPCDFCGGDMPSSARLGEFAGN